MPKDPALLLSYVNTKLRDEFGSLSELARANNIPEGEIEAALAAIDYHYDPEQNQFK